MTIPEPFAQQLATTLAPSTVIVRPCPCTALPTAEQEVTFTVGEWTVRVIYGEHLTHDDGTDVLQGAAAEIALTISAPTHEPAALIATGMDLYYLRVDLDHLSGRNTTPVTARRWVANAHRLLTAPARWARPSANTTTLPANIDAADLPQWLLTGWRSRGTTAAYRTAGFDTGMRVREWLEVLPRADVLHWARVTDFPAAALVFRAAGYTPADAVTLLRYHGFCHGVDFLTAVRAHGWSATHLAAAFAHYTRKQSSGDQVRASVLALADAAAGLDLDAITLALRAGVDPDEAVEAVRTGALTADTARMLAAMT